MGGEVTVVGGGLAGSEAAWQLARQGVPVTLFEMRPDKTTGAHSTGLLGELVCSNSLGSRLADRASGILMAELTALGSLLLECARQVALPAGGALAVDREGFASLVTQRLEGHPLISLVREEAVSVPEGTAVIATGPLTSPAFAGALAEITGQEYLYFYDALSPIVEGDSLDYSVVFRASRYGRGIEADGDYLNAPMTREEYESFVKALVGAARIPLREFEADIARGVRAGPDRYFEACLPVEVIAERGLQALAYGPMRPVGLVDPRTGARPYAVVQLRQDDQAGRLFNIVGFQTNLTYPEQARVFRMIPGLTKARFTRFGQMHRNTFINSPVLLDATLEHRHRRRLFFAGQITGAEGYLGNMGTGLLAGLNAARCAHGEPPLSMPPTTMLGALCAYITSAQSARFQPMKANLGLLPPLPVGGPRRRRERAAAHAHRSQAAISEFLLCVRA